MKEIKQFEKAIRDSYNYKIVNKTVHGQRVDVKVYDDASVLDCAFHTRTLTKGDKRSNVISLSTYVPNADDN